MSEPGENVASVQTAEIGITGMTCDHCARRVEGALSKIDGVKTARVDRAAARATVSYDSARTGIQALREAVIKSGYRVTS